MAERLIECAGRQVDKVFGIGWSFRYCFVQFMFIWISSFNIRIAVPGYCRADVRDC